MNRNYVRGRRYEYKTMRTLEKLGYLCIRTAGSHSPFDVIAFLTKDNTEHHIIRAIQVKASKYVPKKEIEKFKRVVIPTIITKELWHYTKKELIIINVK